MDKLPKRRFEAWMALLRVAREQRGQALTEYAMTSTILIMGAIAGGAGWPFFTMLVTAFDTYLQSIYYTVNLALP
jgi:hypothetical protein